MGKNLGAAVALAVIIPALALTVSCAKKMVQTQPAAMAGPEVQKAPDRSAEKAGKAEQVKEDRLLAEAAVREAAKAAFTGEPVHFSFNSSQLSEQARQVLNSKADYLRMNPEIKITVEGHCDERGTNAYNIALGERRAESVTMFLAGLGISANRLNTVSYGEERPVAAGHNEASWAENRRAQFVIN